MSEQRPFQAGDRVRVLRGECIPGGIQWVSHRMDEFVGREFALSHSVDVAGTWCWAMKDMPSMCSADLPWRFHPSWLVLVEPTIEPAPRPGQAAPVAKFKVGDRVRITKPSNLGEDPVWVPKTMDEFNGVVRRVTAVGRETGWLAVEGSHYSFHPDWCTAAPADKPVTKPSQLPASNAHTPTAVVDITPVLNRALTFLSGLQLQDQPRAVQQEQRAIVRELMEALKPGSTTR